MIRDFFKKNKEKITIILLFLFIIFTVVFYIWSKLFLLSIFLIIIFDSITTQFFYKKIKDKLSKKLIKITKYACFFILPIGVAVFCRVFFFEIYSIPSGSMETTLTEGDMIVISKLPYGPKMPNSVEEVPFGGIFFWKKKSTQIELQKHNRLKGIYSIKRNDVIVFRGTKENYTKKFVKRIIGLPSDTLKIIDSKVFINQKAQEELTNYVFEYNYKTDKIKDNSFILSNNEYEKLSPEKRIEIERTIHKPKTDLDNIYPYEKVFEWNRDNYGHVIIPKINMKILLTPDNIHTYIDVISLETGKKVEIDSNKKYL